jgi:hypothetical protein
MEKLKKVACSRYTKGKHRKLSVKALNLDTASSCGLVVKAEDS